MLHLKHNKDFPYIYRSGHLRIRMRLPLSPAQAEEIKALALTPLAEKKRKTSCISHDRSYFIKLNKIKRVSKQLRVTVGIAKPFDYYLKELKNNILLDSMPVHSPGLSGYFMYTKMGLTQRAGLIFNNMEGQINAASHITSTPLETNITVGKALCLLASLHEQDIYHMDPRLENMLLNPAEPHNLCAIDFEHCYIGRPTNKTAMTGMVYGMFYRSGVEACVSEHEYDQMVSSTISQTNMDDPSFIKIYRLSKARFMERKECRKMFYRGRI